MKRTRIAAAIGTIAVTFGVLTACSGSGNFTAHGNETVCVDAQDITDGTQVTVTDSNNHVIGTGTLTEDDSAAALATVKAYDSEQLSFGAFGLGSGSGMSIYKFTVTVPDGEARYGVNAGQNRGTLWFSETEMKSGPQMSLGC